MREIQIFRGKVIDGKKLGRKIGFPTANIELSKSEKMKFGSWVVKITIDGVYYYGVGNIGNRPTVNLSDDSVLLEVNIFNFNGDIYGEVVEVELLEFLRDESRFESIEELKMAIDNDVKEAKKIISIIK